MFSSLQLQARLVFWLETERGCTLQHVKCQQSKIKAMVTTCNIDNVQQYSNMEPEESKPTEQYVIDKRKDGKH
jgi:hypothetical protein